MVRRREAQRRLQLRRPIVDEGFGSTVAIHWESEPGDSRTITYSQLQQEVAKTANPLLSLGLRAGERVAIYLPMIPEAVFSMPVCARLGIPHSVVLAGFSAEAQRSRMGECECPAGDHRGRAGPARQRGFAQGRR